MKFTKLVSILLKDENSEFQHLVSNFFFCLDFWLHYGLPVSAVIAELVMEYVESQVLSTFYPVPRWWHRYVDDSNACIKSRDLDRFQRHLNAVNSHTQFTVERTTLMDGIAFLDTSLSVLPNGCITV